MGTAQLLSLALSKDKVDQFRILENYKKKSLVCFTNF